LGIGIYECIECQNIEYDDWGKVKKFLDENGSAPIMEIEERTGVHREVVQKMFHEGRLEVAPDSAVSLRCERCGAGIMFGRYCRKCKQELAGDVKAMFDAEGLDQNKDIKLNGQMRFFKKKR